MVLLATNHIHTMFAFKHFLTIPHTHTEAIWGSVPCSRTLGLDESGTELLFYLLSHTHTQSYKHVVSPIQILTGLTLLNFHDQMRSGALMAELPYTAPRAVSKDQRTFTVFDDEIMPVPDNDADAIMKLTKEGLAIKPKLLSTNPLE